MMEKTLARRSDPDTSHTAAASVVDGLSRQHASVLRVLTAAGRPLAAEQISDIAGFDVWRRMNELVAAGHIEQAGSLHKNRSGRQAHQFRLRPAGQLKLI
jgi:hypothetical protein